MAILTTSIPAVPIFRGTRREAGFLLLGLFLWAYGAEAGQPLRFGWKPGLELRYRLKIQGRNTASLGDRSQSSTLETRLHLTQRVLARGEDGVSRILTRVESGRASRNDEDSKVLPPRQNTMRMDDRGRILDSLAPDQAPSPLQLVFPERPLEIGDSWFNSLPPSEEIPVPIRMRYTLVGNAEVAGLACTRIALEIESARASALEGPMELSFHATGTLYFAHQEGILVSSEVHTDLTLNWSQPREQGDEAVQTRASFDILLEYRP